MSEKLTQEEISSIVYFIKDKIRENNSDYHITKDDVDEFKGKHPRTYSKLKKRSHDVTEEIDEMKKKYLKFKGKGKYLKFKGGDGEIVPYNPEFTKAIQAPEFTKAIQAIGQTLAQTAAQSVGKYPQIIAQATGQQESLKKLGSVIGQLKKIKEKYEPSFGPMINTLIESASQLPKQQTEVLEPAKPQSLEQTHPSPDTTLQTQLQQPSEPIQPQLIELLQQLPSTLSHTSQLPSQELPQKLPESYQPSSFSPEIVISIADKKCANVKELCDNIKGCESFSESLKNKSSLTDTEKLIKVTCELCNQYQPKQEGGKKKYHDIFISNQKVFYSNSLHSLDSSSYYLNYTLSNHDL